MKKSGADTPVKVAWNLLGNVFPSTSTSVALEKRLRIQMVAFSKAFVFMLAVVLRNTSNTMENYSAVSCSLYYFAAIWCLQKAKDFSVMDREKMSAVCGMVCLVSCVLSYVRLIWQICVNTWKCYTLNSSFESTIVIAFCLFAAVTAACHRCWVICCHMWAKIGFHST